MKNRERRNGEGRGKNNNRKGVRKGNEIREKRNTKSRRMGPKRRRMMRGEKAAARRSGKK